MDLFFKRFVRDHLRYADEVHCAAARIVNKLRQLAIQNGHANGEFDTFHVRRNDIGFINEHLQVSADEIYENSCSVLREGAIVYVATDETNTSYFEPLKKHYQLFFLKDFEGLIKQISPQKYGMLEQLVATRGRTFVGVFGSTFSGYINRIRGYHTQKDRSVGYDKGIIESYYYVLEKTKYDMRQYRALDQPVWAREFPTAWRLIDYGIPPEHNDS